MYSYDRRGAADEARLTTLIRQLDKRQRIALRAALQRGDNSGSAPDMPVKKLIRLGLALDSGHRHEPTAWGEVVRSQPIFYLTPLGKEVAQALVNSIKP